MVTLTADSGGTTLTGSYTVHADDTSLTDLNVSSFALGDGTGGVPADQAGNVMTSTTLPANMIADTQDIVVDTGKPLVNAIERVAADDSNIDTDGVTSTTPVTFEVTFSEAIDASTVTAGDFVASNGTVGTVVENSDTLSTDAVAGSGYTSFFVEVTPAADGEVSLGLVDGSSFTDIAGNTVVHDPGGVTGGSVDADGSLASFDANSPRGRRMDLYEGLPVRLDADTAVSWTINMTAGFDTYLHFYSKNPETGSLSLLASDDDGGNGLNSRISFNPEVGVEYVIGASAYSSGSSSYSLFLRQTVDGTAGPNYPRRRGDTTGRRRG